RIIGSPPWRIAAIDSSTATRMADPRDESGQLRCRAEAQDRSRGDVLDAPDEELAGRIGQRAELHDERALRRKRRFGRCDGGLPGAPVVHARLDTALLSEKSVKTPVNFAPGAVFVLGRGRPTGFLCGLGPWR